MNVNVFKTQYANVTYIPEKRLLMLVWDGNPTHEEYKQPFLAMIEFSKKSPVDSMLTDITKQGVMSPENRKWFQREMMMKGIEHGLKRVAIVTPANAFKLYYINMILSGVKKLPLATKVFGNQSDALAWLDSFALSQHTM